MDFRKLAQQIKDRLGDMIGPVQSPITGMQQLMGKRPIPVDPRAARAPMRQIPQGYAPYRRPELQVRPALPMQFQGNGQELQGGYRMQPMPASTFNPQRQSFSPNLSQGRWTMPPVSSQSIDFGVYDDAPLQGGYYDQGNINQLRF